MQLPGAAPVLKLPKIVPPFFGISAAAALHPKPVVALAAAQPLKVPTTATSPVPAIVPRKSLDTEAGGDNQESRRSTSEVCTFGFNCKRPDCWYAHPVGRAIGNSSEAVYCKFGVKCTRPNCFYKHPEGRECEPDKFEIYLDELEMPNRPPVFASNEEREVFVDPFPCAAADNPEFEAFTSAFGETESVFQIPGQERGYILFKDHRSAKACTMASSGTWSESERCSTSRRWREYKKKGGKTHCAYPMSLPRLIAGEEAQSNLVEINEQLQLPGRLRFKTNDGPARFIGACSADQKEEVTRLVTELVAEAHDKVNEILTEIYLPRGLPKGFDDEQAKTLFEAYGETASIVLSNLDKESPRQCPIARVVYKKWQDAASAQKDLNQANLFDIPITCQLKFPDIGPGKKSREANQEMQGDGDNHEQEGDDQEGRDAPRERRSWNDWNQRKRNREEWRDYGDQATAQRWDDRHRDKRRRASGGRRWEHGGHHEDDAPQYEWHCPLCGIGNAAEDDVCGGTNAYFGCKEPRPC